ncbi:hypothetical protein [Nocardia jiangxiensis]|uniref:Uncharacterized protein n=1 Tax=Nocardia jiangxiensis TaxID=282685 RepID=A0ABW6SBP4_9NOCA|nr:hypothetical protein [Nocardia jiangxiensis]
MAKTWTGTTWFIEGDIADCYGSFDQDVLVGILVKHIRDNRFLRLLRGSGCCHSWGILATLSLGRTVLLSYFNASWVMPKRGTVSSRMHTAGSCGLGGESLG